MIRRIPKIAQFGFLIVLLLLGFMSLYRLVFWWMFGEQLDWDVLMGFYIGFKFDLRLAMLSVLPLFLFGWIKPINPVHGRWQYFWLWYLMACFLLLLGCLYLDFGHYAYLKTHINATAFRFVADLNIATKMLWQSYPIVWILLSALLWILLYWLVLIRISRWVAAQIFVKHPWWQRLLMNSLIGLMVFGGLYGKISLYPMRWVDAYFSERAFIADLSQNPVLYLFDTLRYSGAEYDLEKVKQHFPRMKNYLKLGDNPPLDFKRSLAQTPMLKGKPNVVLVFLESFAGYKTGAYNNPINPSPNFDQAAKDGLLFNRFYVNHTGTARSVFVNITGIPDTHHQKTATRDPQIVNQNTLINAFDDYEKLYFLGGSMNWGNIRGLLQHNIPGLKIFEEGFYQAPNQDVWGISDADLFLEASAVLKKQAKPFLAVVQTSGNHQPYTIPEPNYGFVRSTLNNDQVKKYGFESVKEFDSFRFMDHSLGLFFEQAKKDGYYHNTVFVIFADHGINAYNGDHRPQIESDLSIGSFLIPLVIHAPKFIKPQKIDTVASQPDMLAIVAGLFGKDFTNGAMGRNMLNSKYHDQQFAFIISHGGVPSIGLIGRDYLFKMNAQGENQQLHQLGGDMADRKRAQNVIKSQPKIAKDMRLLTEAIYETSRYLLHHNKPNP